MKFLKVQDNEKRHAVLINREHIVSIHQNGISEVIVSFVNGEKIKIAAMLDDFRNLVETGSPFEQNPKQTQG